jgi:hypothetical protein
MKITKITLRFNAENMDLQMKLYLSTKTHLCIYVLARIYEYMALGVVALFGLKTNWLIEVYFVYVLIFVRKFSRMSVNGESAFP